MGAIPAGAAVSGRETRRVSLALTVAMWCYSRRSRDKGAGGSGGSGGAGGVGPDVVLALLTRMVVEGAERGEAAREFKVPWHTCDRVLRGFTAMVREMCEEEGIGAGEFVAVEGASRDQGN